MSNWALILAAGAGVRLGTPKAFLTLQGKPMLWYSLQAFEKSSHIDKIGVVCRNEDQEKTRSILDSFMFKKIEFLVSGGKERQDSVFEGMKALPPGVHLVAIHDAARPLITSEIIDAVIEKANESGAAIAAIPSKDTIKISQNGVIEKTLNRDSLWIAQTPQVFKYHLFQKAIEKAFQDHFYGTDCASLLERLGIAVYLVPGSSENLKITNPSDMVLAESLLKERVHA